MISAHLMFMFIVALIIVCALPGADMALVMQTSMSRGAKSGFAAACGLGISRATHVTLSACGLAALLRNAPTYGPPGGAPRTAREAPPKRPEVGSLQGVMPLGSLRTARMPPVSQERP